VLPGGQPEVPCIDDAQEIQQEAGRNVEEREGDQEECRRPGFPIQQEEGGNLKYNLDFRCVYTTILDDWLGLNPGPIVGGSFEPVKFLNN